MRKTSEQQQPAISGDFHIESLGRAMISLESGADPGANAFVAREPAQAIELRTGTTIWIAAEVTDMRCGFQGLSVNVQTVIGHQPLSGHVFIFRGRKDDLIKLIWLDGDSLCNPPTENPLALVRTAAGLLSVASLA